MKTTLTTLLLFVFLQAQAQTNKQNNNWIFGFNARVEFSNVLPSSSSLPFNSIEACAVVSHPETGQLLFYTDGIKVMDKNGNMLQNGDSLMSLETSAQGALILPHPEIKNQYLIFTAPAFTSANPALYYSVVDISLNNGLGAVIKGQKNILLYKGGTESLTYTFNEDSSAYWLISHERENNTFICIEVSKFGIGKNIVKTSIGRNWLGLASYMSPLKVSSNGKRLVVSNIFNPISSEGQVEVYDFDPCTGKISNEIVIRNLPRECYGAAFSPNSQVLYISSLYFPSKLFQVDLLAGNETQINASKQTIFTAPLAPANQNRITYLGGLSNGEDGKIYLTEQAQRFLHCINDPNNLGLACNFEPQKIQLLPNTRASYTLPQLVPSKLNAPKFIENTASISINDTCLERVKEATISGISNFSVMEWKLISINKQDTQVVNNVNSLNLNDLTIGSYVIEVLVRQECKYFFARKAFTITDCICTGDIVLSDTCLEKQITLSVSTTDSIKEIEWNLRDANNLLFFKSRLLQPKVKLPDTGVYTATAYVVFNCYPDTLNKTFLVGSCPQCENFYIPNVFTPNNDGVNELFEVSTSCQLDNLELAIYNRWGALLYESKNLNAAWDGQYNKLECPEGVYFYVVSYTINGLKEQTAKGTLTLLR